MLTLRKIISSAIILSIVASSSIIAPVAVNAADDSYRDGFINALMDSQNKWMPLSSNSVRMAPGFSFMDLDFDGRNELYVQEAGGTMDNHSARIYYYENNQLKEATGKEYGEYLNGLTYYYNNNTGSYFILGVNSCAAGFASDRWTGNYTFTFNNHKPAVNYYSARYMKVDRQTYQQSFTYYDGANGYGDSSSANVISETQYNNLNNQVVSNCVNVNMKSEKILKNDWNGYSTSEKRAKLLSSYNAFSYDKKSLTTSYGKDIYVCDNYQYYIENNEAHIIGYTGTLTNLVLPDEIFGYKVTVLGNMEGSYTEPMKGFSNVKSIVLGKNVRRINENAFSNCSELTSVNISSGVREISWCAFSNCQKLSNISLPDSVVFLGTGVFDNTAWYNSQPNGVLYIGKIAYGYKGTMPNNYSLSIKNGTCGIAAYAFSGQSNLVSVSVPDSVHCIGRGAFDGTSWYNNTKSSMTNGAVYVGKVLYKYIGSIPENLALKAGTAGIAERALYDGAGAYWNSNSSSNLRSISLPDSLISICPCAFENCINLSELTIPRSVQYIGEYAYGFHACHKAAVIKADGYEISIRGEKGTEAEKYATYYNIRFIHFVKRDSVGFDLTKHGHCVINSSDSFGYTRWTNWFGVFGYKIPLERYQEVYGEKYTKHIYNQNVTSWGGNCFGMSATAVLFYNKKIPVTNYTHDMITLTSGGYDDMVTTDGLVYLRLNSDSELTKLVERYQIWQSSDEFHSMRENDAFYKNEKYSQAFSQVVTEVRNNREPYILRVFWDGEDGKRVGHALVVDSSKYPTNLGNGWNRLYLYDPNNPYFEYFDGKKPVSAYKQAENRFVDINVNNGEWRMAASVNGDGSRDTIIGYNENGVLLLESSIEFLKANQYPVNFDNKANFTPKNNATSIMFMSNDFSVYSIKNELIYRIQNGKTVYCSNSVKEYNNECEFTDGVTNNLTHGTLSLPRGNYSVDVKSGTIAFMENGDYCGVTTKSPTTITNNNSTKLTIEAKDSTQVDIVIEDVNENNSFNSIETNLNIVGTETISLDDSRLEFKNNRTKLDISVVSDISDRNSKTNVMNNSNYLDLSKTITNIYGDINADGVVNAKDRIILARFISKWDDSVAIDMGTADVNDDGLVDAKDRIILARYLANWRGFSLLPRKEK